MTGRWGPGSDPDNSSRRRGNDKLSLWTHRRTGAHSAESTPLSACFDAIAASQVPHGHGRRNLLRTWRVREMREPEVVVSPCGKLAGGRGCRGSAATRGIDRRRRQQQQQRVRASTAGRFSQARASHCGFEGDQQAFPRHTHQHHHTRSCEEHQYK